MALPVYFDNNIAGELSITSCGIYTEFSVDAAPVSGNVLRCRVMGDGELNLGILKPERGRLRLCRRFSKNQLAPLGTPLYGELSSVTSDGRRDNFGWTPCREPGRYISDGFICRCLSGGSVIMRRNGCDCFFAVKYDGRSPMNYIGILCLMRPFTMNGVLMLEIRIGPDGCCKKW